MNIDQLITPVDLEEAYQALLSSPDAVLLGGCGYLRLSDRKIGTAIDLSSLDLHQIVEDESGVVISSMTTLRSIETSSLLRSSGHQILADAVRDIVGVQLRHGVTIGGSVAGRYPFSDPIVALLALDAQLVFYKTGSISLKSFLNSKPLKDILVQIVLPKVDCIAAFASIRKARTDYAVLNTAVAKKGDSYRIVVGSRPARAVRIERAEEYLNQQGLNEKSLDQVAEIVAQSLTFGTNPRGSAEYRKQICPILVKRALTEVMNAA